MRSSVSGKKNVGRGLTRKTIPGISLPRSKTKFWEFISPIFHIPHKVERADVEELVSPVRDRSLVQRVSEMNRLRKGMGDCQRRSLCGRCFKNIYGLYLYCKRGNWGKFQVGPF